MPPPSQSSTHNNRWRSRKGVPERRHQGAPGQAAAASPATRGSKARGSSSVSQAQNDSTQTVTSARERRGPFERAAHARHHRTPDSGRPQSGRAARARRDATPTPTHMAAPCRQALAAARGRSWPHPPAAAADPDSSVRRSASRTGSACWPRNSDVASPAPADPPPPASAPDQADPRAPPPPQTEAQSSHHLPRLADTTRTSNEPATSTTSESASRLTRRPPGG